MNSTNEPKSYLLPVLPIRNTILYPQLLLPLAVGRAGSMAAVEAAMAGEDKTLLVVTQKEGANDHPARADTAACGSPRHHLIGIA